METPDPPFHDTPGELKTGGNLTPRPTSHGALGFGDIVVLLDHKSQAICQSRSRGQIVRWFILPDGRLPKPLELYRSSGACGIVVPETLSSLA